MRKLYSSDISESVELPPIGCSKCRISTICMPCLVTDEDRANVLGLLTHRVRIDRGAPLFIAGNTFKSLYIVRLGQLKIVEQDHLGIENVTAFHMPGESLGWDGIANGYFRVGAIALEDSEICVMPFSKLEALLSEVPRLHQQFLRTLGQRLVDIGRHALRSSHSFLDQRFASFILDVANYQMKAGYSPSAFHLRMSRGDLCSYLCTSPEGLSRMIAKFKRAGLIRMTRRDIEILEPEQLRQLADGYLERCSLAVTAKNGYDIANDTD